MSEKKEMAIAITTIIIFAGILAFIFTVLKTDKKTIEDALEYCQNQGHSYNHCVKGLYGN